MQSGQATTIRKRLQVNFGRGTPTPCVQELFSELPLQYQSAAKKIGLEGVNPSPEDYEAVYPFEVVAPEAAIISVPLGPAIRRSIDAYSPGSEGDAAREHVRDAAVTHDLSSLRTVIIEACFSELLGHDTNPEDLGRVQYREERDREGRTAAEVKHLCQERDVIRQLASATRAAVEAEESKARRAKTRSSTHCATKSASRQASLTAGRRAPTRRTAVTEHVRRGGRSASTVPSHHSSAGSGGGRRTRGRGARGAGMGSVQHGGQVQGPHAGLATPRLRQWENEKAGLVVFSG